MKAVTTLLPFCSSSSSSIPAAWSQRPRMNFGFKQSPLFYNLKSCPGSLLLHNMSKNELAAKRCERLRFLYIILKRNNNNNNPPPPGVVCFWEANMWRGKHGFIVVFLFVEHLLFQDQIISKNLVQAVNIMCFCNQCVQRKWKRDCSPCGRT